MNKQASMIDLNALSEDVFHKWRLSKEVQPFENTWYFPNEKESGAVHEIDLQPGLQIVVMDLKPKEKLAMTLELEHAPLSFSFFLSYSGTPMTLYVSHFIFGLSRRSET